MKPTQSWKHRGIDIAEWRNEKGVNYTIRKTYFKKATGEYIEAKSWYREELKELYRLLGETVATFGEDEAMPELAFTASQSKAAYDVLTAFNGGPLPVKPAAAVVAFNDDDIPF